MKLTTFDIPKGSVHYVELPSGRCINVHVATLPDRTMLHVQANHGEQWPQEYSDSLLHCFKCVEVFHAHASNLSHEDINFLQDKFFRPYSQLTFK